MDKQEKLRIRFSLFFPGILLVTMWIIAFFVYSFDLSLYKYGIYPLRLSKLSGILFAPLLHSGFNHLLSNMLPFLFLSFLLFYFYKDKAFVIFAVLYIFSGLGVWIWGRNCYHIGASGLIYALASFLFFSGIIHKNTASIALSLLMIFLYGHLIWGVFPLFSARVSWESHLSGGITGMFFSFVFSGYKPLFPERTYAFEEEDEDEEADDEEAPWKCMDPNLFEEK